MNIFLFLKNRSKCKTLAGVKKVNDLGELPEWNFDGTSCYMAPTENSEIILKPVNFYPDPFRGGNNIFVLCECYSWVDTKYEKLVPSNSNFRAFAKKIFDAAEGE